MYRVVDASCLSCRQTFDWDMDLPMFCGKCLTEMIQLPFDLKPLGQPNGKPIYTVIPSKQVRRQV